MKSITRGHLKAGLDSVRNTKWRNFWTMLGVIIGVASVILVVGIGDGIKQQIDLQASGTNSNVIAIRPSTINGTGNSPLSTITGFNIAGTLNSSDESVVSNTPGVAAAAPLSAQVAKVSGNESTFKNGLVIGTNQNLLPMLNQTLSSGNFLSPNYSATNAVVLGANAAYDLFNVNVPLGETLTINGHPFEVTGILNPFPSAPLSQTADYNNAVFVTYSLAQGLSNNSASTFEILARPNHGNQLGSVASAVKHRLTAAHSGQTDFSVLTGSQSLASSDNVLTLLTEMITGVAAISLIVGGVGIMNVMLVSVTERMHEIGIRKAIGASNRQILSQFIIESTLLSLSGGVIGIIIALLVDAGIRLATSLQPEIGWQIVLLAAGVSIVIGIIFGSVPALKAARKDPIDALRVE
jgi:putative ABC transport system permease protein